MCKKIRIGSLTFVMIIMSLFFALPAMAADIFSVTVPTGIPVTLNADGSITTATNVEITNNSSKGVAISNLQLIPATNWKLVEFTDDFVNKKVNTKEFALQILGQGFKADGNFDESGLSAIGVGSKLVLNYAVKVTAQSSAFVSTLGNLVFTLDWIPPSPESWFVFDSATGSVTGLSATYKALKPLPTVIDIPATIGGVPVKAIGKTAFNGCSGLTSITIPNGVTSIGNGAFMYCSSLTSINIPDGVTSINNRMFDGCSSLTSITIPKGVISIGNSVFKDCSSLTSITIPDGVTSIGDMVFSGCTGLTSMSIPNSVTSIGDIAFNGCSGLTSISIDKVKDSITGSPWGAAASTTINWLRKPPSPESWFVFDSATGTVNGFSATYKALNPLPTVIDIPATIGGVPVKAIGERNPSPMEGFDGAFKNCKGLTSMSIPNGVTFIGNNAFAGCSSLTSIKIPNKIEYIAVMAFAQCTGLTSVTIPNTVTRFSISDNVFSDCTGLTSINIPNSVTSIGIDPFSGCTALTAINIDNVKDSIAGSPWGAAASTTVNWLRKLSSPESWFVFDSATGTVTGLSATYNALNPLPTVIDIPATIGGVPVKAIGDSAFNDCSGLTSISIPNGVTSIGYNTFKGCHNLTSVTIPNSVTSIGNGAFYACIVLTSITIPNNITSIGIMAFGNCVQLTSVTIPNSVTSIGRQAFYGCSSLTSVTIPNSVTSIGSGTFSGCIALTAINIDKVKDSITGSPWGAAASTTINWLRKPSSPESWFDFDSATGTVTGLSATYNALNPLPTVIDVPATIGGVPVKAIGSGAFSDLSQKITSITIPDGVTSIGNYAFEYCVDLTSFNIPNTVTSIGIGAFAGCFSLTSINIPNGVTSIGDMVFDSCSSLTSITIDKVKDSITGSPWGAAASTTINWAGKMAAAPIMSMTVELLPIPPAIGESAGGIRPAQPPVNDSNLNPSPNPNQLAKPNQPPISDSNLNPNQVVKPAQPPMENNINNGTNKDVSITKDVQKKEVVVPNKPSEVDGEGKKI